jgi:hypothetical protein
MVTRQFSKRNSDQHILVKHFADPFAPAMKHQWMGGQQECPHLFDFSPVSRTLIKQKAKTAAGS